MRTLFETLPERIIYKDANSIFVSCNRNFAEDFGFSPREIAGKTDFDLYPKELATKYVLDDQRVMRTGETEEYEERHRKGEEEQTVRTIKVPFRDEEGNVVGVLAIFWDITESKRKEEALRISEERLALALDASQDGLWDWNLITNEAYYNPTYSRMLGYNPLELQPLRETWKNLLHPEDVSRSIRSITEAIVNSDAYDIEFRLRKKDGAWLWVRSRGKVVKRDSCGKATRMAGSHIDISERKASEDEREKLIAELEAKNEELERFTYTVSHDLKSPLALRDSCLHNTNRLLLRLFLCLMLLTQQLE
ncbi:MAG TPA: PAS domain S-box protein, partial [Bacteroidales bacterium]|nr:PAS domain S-box protein [Bacteroidales bacterium]